MVSLRRALRGNVPRAFAAVLAVLVTVAVFAGASPRAYFCSAMQETRAEPCCPSAHDDGPAPAIEEAGCGCCGVVQPAVQAPAIARAAVEIPSTSPLALALAPDGARGVASFARDLRSASPPPTGPPPRHPPRSLRMVFLL